MNKPLPEAALAALKNAASVGREAWHQGNTMQAEQSFLSAWAAIPEPKLEYDYAQSLSRGFVVFYRDTAQFEKALNWIEVLRAACGPTASDSNDFLEATVLHDAGRLDEAFRLFDAQYKKYKRRLFEGLDKKYLAFYENRAKGR